MTPRKKTTDPLDPVHIGNDDPEEVAAGVEVRRLSNGLGVLVPRSVRSLAGEALEVIGDIQHTAADIHQAQQDLDALVAEARAVGVPWSAIGWSVGTSDAAARQRWGSR